MPFFVHILLFFGALVGFMTLASILALMGIFSIENPNTCILHGILFIGFAFSLYYPFQRSSSMMRSFSLQMSTMFMIAGKYLLIYAAWLLSKNTWHITIALGVLTLSTYFFYKNSFERFLFSLLFMTSILYNLFEYKHSGLLFLYLLCALSIGFFMHHHVYRLDLKPFHIANFVTLCIICMIVSYDPHQVSFIHYKEGYFSADKISEILYTTAYALFIIGFIFYHAGIKETLQKPYLLFSCIAVLLLAAVSNAGIVWGMALMIMGYHGDRKYLLFSGGIFLTLFLIFNYYNMSLTLDYKAYVLMCSGILLWSARLAMKYLQWDQR